LGDVGEISRAAAVEFTRSSIESVERAGLFTVALSGGSTPGPLYALLANSCEPYRRRVAWDRIHFFWGDERHVPPDSPESNYRMAEEWLLSRVPVPAGNIHRIQGELPDPGEAADEYERDIRRHFHLAGSERPRFDLIFLGMGEDGHTASLFPGTAILHERERLASAVWVDKMRSHRISLTPPVLNNAASVIFLVSGVDKAVTLDAVLNGPYRPDLLPAQLIRPVNGRLLWLVDRGVGGRDGERVPDPISPREV
jgi:6-phosphogluconolactonase